MQPRLAIDQVCGRRVVRARHNEAMRLPDWPGSDSAVAAEGLPRDGSGSGDIEVHPPAHRGSDWYRELSSRLARLPEAHPSAWPVAPTADWADGRDRDSEIWWRGDPVDLDERPGELDDGLGSDEYGEAGLGEDGQFGPIEDGGGLGAGPDSESDESDSRSREHGSARGFLFAGQGQRRASAGWGELGGSAPGRSPYRPWFSAAGTADPWFAAEWGE